MKKLLLYGVPSMLFLLVLLYIVLFLVDINRVKTSPNNLQIQKQDVHLTKQAPKDWRKRLEKSSKEDDYYSPVTEISIDLDLYYDVASKFRHRERHFKLKTQKLNSYHYFCLKQVLDQLHTHHKLEAYQNDIGVILYSNNSESLQEVTSNLALYGIKSSIEEIIRK